MFFTAFEEKIIGIIGNVLDISTQFMNLETKFSDLGADSLDVVDIVMTLEEEFNIEIIDCEMSKIVGWTLRDFILYINQNR